jgi:hypothetical protein
MTDNRFLVVLPAEDFRCVLSTFDHGHARAVAREIGGSIAIVPESLPFSALLSFLKIHGERAAAALRRFEWRRDRIAVDPSCDFCRRKVGLAKSTVDHAVPISRGGPDTPDNWLLSCRRCNNAKGDDTLSEFRERIMAGVLFDRFRGRLAEAAEPDWPEISREISTEPDRAASGAKRFRSPGRCESSVESGV